MKKNMDIKDLVPHMRRKRALLIVDAEAKFLTDKTEKAIPGIVKLILDGDYDLYVVAEYAEGQLEAGVIHKSGWQKQFGELHTKEETIPAIRGLLDEKKTYKVVKTTRSLFGNTKKLAAYLKRKQIDEVHIAGLETHDCILATALDAFDHDFFTYVIEEACASKEGKLHESAIEILRKLNLTNHTVEI